MKLIIAILIPLCLGALAGYATTQNIPTWYAFLSKPNFTPPNYLFGPVWTSLYIMMGIASYLIWKSNNLLKKRALILYIVQLTLNFSWSFVFFYFHQLGGAMIVIVLMWLFILFTIISFFKINKISAYLLIPYLLWVSYASALNYAVWQMNE
jgi:translocator protein